MSPRMSRREAGLTMIEVAIASLILAAIIAMSSWLVWQASDHVASAEVNVQLEQQAREVLDAICKELRQSKRIKFRAVDPASITVNASTLSMPTTPGNAIVPVAGTTYDAIRFPLPGLTMDLTTKNANNDPSSGGNLANFDMKRFQANQDNAWTTEIQYWWEVDNSYIANEGAAGAGPNGWVPNNIDDNRNGLIDEGVLKKLESLYDNAGNLVKRTQSIVCRDVKYDWNYKNPITGAPAPRSGFVVVIPTTDAAGVPYPLGSEKCIQISLTLQKRDPRYPKDSKKLIEKTVTMTVDVRN